jgi:hypothetical protein
MWAGMASEHKKRIGEQFSFSFSLSLCLVSSHFTDDLRRRRRRRRDEMNETK